MAYEVEVTISSAKDLKNVNWRHGDLKPYAVVWVDPNSKCSTKVDEYGDTNPVWDETLVIPLRGPIEDSTLYIDVVHAHAADDTKPLVGSAKLPLREVVDEVGIGGRSELKLKLKRPSGRPHGKLDVKVAVRQPRYRAPDPSYAPPYGVPPPTTTRDYGAPQQYNYSYGSPYEAADPRAGYGYQAPPVPQYNQGQYAAAGGYGGYDYGSQSVQPEKKGSKFGMGTGLAVGAVAGVLGGLALAEGAEYVEDKIADEAAEKVEDDLGYGGDDYGDDDGGDF